jgi:hypothetical protein
MNRCGRGLNLCSASPSNLTHLPERESDLIKIRDLVFPRHNQVSHCKQFVFLETMNQLDLLRQWLPSSERMVKAAEENRQAIAVAAGVVSLVGAAHIYRKKRRTPKLQGKSIRSLPGPDYLPIIGNNHQFKMDELVSFCEAISWLVSSFSGHVSNRSV